MAFAARQGYRALPQVHVSQSYIHQRPEFLGDFGDRPEEFVRLGDGHFQHIVDVFALVPDRQGIFLVSFAAAFLANHVNGRQEIHFNDLDARAFAFLAASAGNIEREPAGLEAAHLGVGRILEEVADVAEHAGKGGRIAAGRASDGALVNFNQFVYVADTHHLLIGERTQFGAVEFIFEDGHEGLADER